MLQTPFVLALCLRILLGFQERLFTIGCPYLQLDSRSQNNVDSITGNRQQKRKPLLLSLFLLQSIATLGNVHLYSHFVQTVQTSRLHFSCALVERNSSSFACGNTYWGEIAQ